MQRGILLQRKTIVLMVLLVVLAGMAILAWNNLTPRETVTLPTVVIVTVTPSNMMTATPPFAEQAPTATPVMRNEDLSKLAGYGHWSTLAKVRDEVEILHFSVSSVPPFCSVMVKGKGQIFYSAGTQCVASDYQGNEYIVPWPGWVHNCKIPRYITPRVTTPMTLTVKVPHYPVMYVVPGQNERVECVIAGKGYQAGDPFPVPGRMPMIIDLSSLNGKTGWVIGGWGFSSLSFGWVRVNEDGSLGEYKEIAPPDAGGGWWINGDTLYITLSDHRHICVNLADKEPKPIECAPTE